MKNKWIDVRKKKPKHLQNVFFLSTGDKRVYVGFFIESDGKAEGLIGTFIVGTIYDESAVSKKLQTGGGAWGIGFHVWEQNKYEVTHWMPLNYPKPPKK